MVRFMTATSINGRCIAVNYKGDVTGGRFLEAVRRQRLRHLDPSDYDWLAALTSYAELCQNVGAFKTVRIGPNDDPEVIEAMTAHLILLDPEGRIIPIGNSDQKKDARDDILAASLGGIIKQRHLLIPTEAVEGNNK